MFTFRYKDPETRDKAKAAAETALSSYSKTLKIEYKDPNTMIMKNAPGIMKTMAKIHSDIGFTDPVSNFKTNFTQSTFKPNDFISNKPINFFYGNYYQIPTDNAPVVPPRIGIVSLGGSYWSSDLQAAWALSGRKDPYKEPTCVILPGSNYQPNVIPDPIVDPFGHNACGENTLDLQLIMTNAPPNAIITIYMGKYSYDGFIMALARADINNHIVSCSWGIPELALSDNILVSLDKTLSRVVSNGTAMLAASGDTGSRPFYASSGGDDDRLSVNFPASSPYSIACGGTSLVFDATGEIITGESGWSGSGGGYSNVYPSPSYQGGIGFRQVPDISMTADPDASPWMIVLFGIIDYYGGTSCVAPAFSAYLSWFFTNKTLYVSQYGILNDIYLAANSVTNSFRPINSGTNDPTGNGQYICSYLGGYSMVTGLGSPVGRPLAAYLQI